jgi:hypothetical protein
VVNDRVADVEDLRGRVQALEGDNEKLRDTSDKAERKVQELEAKLRDAEGQLASVRQAKEAEAQRAANKTPREKMEEAKKIVEERLAAAVMVDGDVVKGRGFLASADGKNWLYAPASVLSGNSKLTVKNSSGDTISEFGAFQLAADADLVRIEVTGEVEKVLEIDPKANLAAGAMLLAATGGADGGPLALSECRIAAAGQTDMELDAYGLDGNQGCPLFDAESGKVIGIIARAAAAPGDVWGASDTTPQIERPKGARLNRTIEWKDSTIAAFLGERRKIDDANRITQLLYALAALDPSPEGMNLDATAGGNKTARQVLDDNKAMAAVQELLKLQESLGAAKMRMSERDIKRRIGSVFSQVGSASRRQSEDLRKIVFTPFHKPLAEACLRWRQDAEDKLADALGALNE